MKKYDGAKSDEYGRWLIMVKSLHLFTHSSTFNDKISDFQYMVSVFSQLRNQWANAFSNAAFLEVFARYLNLEKVLISIVICR